jgi:oligopeptide/dipeptide ABC transporter ATP-binding protein
MYAGQIVETGKARHFFPDPLHPYSKKLMASVPRLRADIEPDFIVGQPPSLINPPTGCRFAARCPSRFDKCSEEPPTFVRDGRTVKCWLYELRKSIEMTRLNLLVFLTHDCRHLGMMECLKGLQTGFGSATEKRPEKSKA